MYEIYISITSKCNIWNLSPQFYWMQYLVSCLNIVCDLSYFLSQFGMVLVMYDQILDFSVFFVLH